MSLGKISGPLLKSNLLRDGVDLAFETDLLYLDVTNNRVGINTIAPTHDLTVNGTTRTTNLELTTSATLGNIVMNGNTIYSTTGILEFNHPTGGQVVYQNKLLVDSIEITQNRISTVDSNANLEFMANGTGTINLQSNTEIFGNLHATGTITADGNLQIGDANTDNVVFNAEIASDILPDVDNLFKIGNPAKRWADIYVGTLNAGSVTTGNITVNGIDIALNQGNIYYVALNGDDGNSGTHQNDPLSSIGRALDLASAGDTVYIYPGVYSETLPLTIPAGVTVKGSGIRSVTIQPDSDKTVDIFLLNGENTVEDLTITGFEYDAVTNTGYAFRFAPGMTVTSRSPYIRNVTVITSGSVTSVGDPRGFDTGDAGRGAYADGSVVNAVSKEASMLFHSVTFICPGVDVLTALNGVRIEWLNCFTYFADRGIYLRSGSTGFAGDGKTRIKIINRTGTFNVGNTLSYYDTDGVTLIASGVIESTNGDFFNIDGKVLGFETPSDRSPKTVVVNGDAKLSTSVKKYGLSSLNLDGTGDYLSIASQPDFNFDTNDFCLEAWVYPTTTGTYRTVFDLRTASPSDGGGIILGITDANALYFYYNFGFRVGPVGTIPQNAWTHIALARVSGNTRAFVNGSQVGSTYADTNNYAQRPVRIGADPNGNFAFTGYIDDVRISKGVGRYSSNFTAPAAALTGDNSTVLLLHFDGTNNSTVIVDDGVTLQDIRTSAGGTASIIDFADYSDFGVELRAIGSANVYGNYGVYGDGIGVLGYLIGQNFAYIGSGKLSNNDPIIIPNDSTNVNEVVQFNDAKIYYTSVDNKGDFKVGDFFSVNQEDGTITFNPNSLTIASAAGVTFTDGVNTTTIVPTYIETGNIKISGNTIESITGGITLTAANNQITATSNTTITGNLSLSNNLTVQGNTTLGNTSSDTVTFNSYINSSIAPSTTGLYDLGSSSNTWRNVWLSSAVIDDITISGNVIATTVSNSNLELRANGTGIVNIQDNAVVDNNLTVNGTTNLQNTTVTGTLTSTNLVSGSITVSSSSILDSIEVNNNYITTTVSNANLELRANGTGIVNIQDSALVDNNLTVNGTTSLQNTTIVGTLSTNNLTVNNPIISGQFSTGDIEIAGNVIRTTLSNSNLELRANGTGSVIFENLNIQQSTISNTVAGQDITLTPSGTGIVNINSNQALQIPVGTDAERPLSPIAGMIRFNTSGNNYEGYNGVGWVPFGVLSDLDRNTYVLPELSPGSNENTLYFYANGSLAATLNSTEFNINRLTVGSIDIDGNIISSNATNTDIELRPNGTGALVIDGFRFTTNTLTNTNAGAVTEFKSTGSGYYHIVGTNAVVIPSGTSLERPGSPQIGMMRFNTDLELVEIYDGTLWISVAGAASGISATQAQEIAALSALIFG